MFCFTQAIQADRKLFKGGIQIRRIHIHWLSWGLKLSEELQWMQTLLINWFFIGKASNSDRDNVDYCLNDIGRFF
jgi:hypothetical protein